MGMKGHCVALLSGVSLGRNNRNMAFWLGCQQTALRWDAPCLWWLGVPPEKLSVSVWEGRSFERHNVCIVGRLKTKKLHYCTMFYCRIVKQRKRNFENKIDFYQFGLTEGLLKRLVIPGINMHLGWSNQKWTALSISVHTVQIHTVYVPDCTSWTTSECGLSDRISMVSTMLLFLIGMIAWSMNSRPRVIINRNPWGVERVRLL